MTDVLERKPKAKAKQIRAVNSVGVVAPPYYATYKQFLDWLDEDTHAEWVDGRIEMTSPAIFKHQDIALFLAQLLKNYIDYRDLGLLLLPFHLKLTKIKRGREPDIVFLAKEHEERLKNTFINGPADLVIEIVSKQSRKRDSITKVDEYQQAGIPEYWIIDPLNNEAIFRQLDQQGQYQKIGLQEGKYYSRVLPDFWLLPEWLWQSPKPKVQVVLAQIGGADYIQYLNEQMKLP